LLARLRKRRPEIEQAILTRVYSIADPTEAGDPAYTAGLKTAVSAALSYGLGGIEAGEAEPGPIPAELFVQARYAVRNGVSLETVIRRYFAGHTLLTDFVMQEAEESDLFRVEELQALGKIQATLVDCLIAAVSEQYQREAERKLPSSEQRQAECVRRLLAGELPDTSRLAYDLDTQHLGAIAAGPEAQEAVRALAATLDRRLLMVQRGGGTVWAWLGAARPPDREQLDNLSASSRAFEAVIALGEPAQGLDGWRFTHRQACAALPIALRGRRPVVRYADVSLLASMLQDDVLAKSLNDLYLAPLAKSRDGGQTLRQTLRAYFAAERNVSSAAAALGVNRHTVANRICTVEERLGRPLSTCAAELEAALHLGELANMAIADNTVSHNVEVVRKPF
jgi:hypothetical protein